MEHENIPKKVIDVTGVELTPGKPGECKGNGKDDPMQCCCDECDYMQLCMEKDDFWPKEGMDEAYFFGH